MARPGARATQGWALATLLFAGAGLAQDVGLERWSGEYYEGDGLGVNRSLTLRRDGTFSFTWDGCLGRYDENEGSATVAEDRLQLVPSKPLDEGIGQPLALRWVPVTWDQRSYLLREDELPLFAKYVNLGREPREGPHGLFFLRRDDWKKKTGGWPALPEPWSAHLLAQPVDARVVRVLGGRRAEIDAGASRRVVPGLLLTAVQADRDWVDVTVLSVEGERSVVEVGESHTLVEGQRVTSKP